MEEEKRMKPWQKKEKRDVKTTGGRPTKRSGGLWFDPGDAKGDDFLTDSKTTDNKSFSITGKMWLKIRKEALLSKRMPCLSVQLNKVTLPNGDPVEFVVLDKADFDSWFRKENK